MINTPITKITIINRYGLKLKFYPINDYQYKFAGTDYMSVTFKNTDNTQIYAIDPIGGPYLAIGNKLGGRTITKIEHNPELLSWIISVDITKPRGE